MNGGNINNYLTAQKLFRPEGNKPEYNRRAKDLTRNTQAKPYHYHLLQQSLNKSHLDEQSFDSPQKVEDHVPKIKIDEHSHSRSVQSQRSNNANKIRMLSTYVQDNPTQEEEAPNLEFIVTKSSRKYFDSCRTEGLSYISKLQQILNKDYQFLQQSLSKIHSSIEQAHGEIADSIKEQLYRVVDQSVDRWKSESLQKFHSQQISYIGQLYELNTQIDERYKQIQVFKNELDSERMWKNRASDLLTSTYEADFIELSKLCRKSVEMAEESVNKYWLDVKKTFTSKFQDKQKVQTLRDKIYLIVKQHSTNKVETKPISTSRVAGQATLPKYEVSNGLKLGEDQATAIKSVNRKTFQGENLNKQENNHETLQDSAIKNSQTRVRDGDLKKAQFGNKNAENLLRLHSFGEQREGE